MLYWKEKGTYIEKVPHDNAFDRWRKIIKDEDYKRIVDTINDIADDADQIDSILIKPIDWIGTLYEPIYHVCNQNRKGAAMFLELIIFKTLIDREDNWQFSLDRTHSKCAERLIYTKKLI